MQAGVQYTKGLASQTEVVSDQKKMADGCCNTIATDWVGCVQRSVREINIKLITN